MSTLPQTNPDVRKASKPKARNAAAWLRGDVRIEIDITAPNGVRLVRTSKAGDVACQPKRS